MKILIVSDLEGVNGVASWKETTRLPEIKEYINIQVKELNAIIEGLSGARVYVRDFHSSMRNVYIGDIAKGAYLVKGSLSSLIGFELLSEVDAVILHGMHAASHTQNAILPHTLSSKLDIYINGIKMSEAMLIATFAGILGKPVIMITGDEATITQMEKFYEYPFEKVVVKQALSPILAICYPLEDVLGRMKQAASTARNFIKKINFAKISSPYELCLNFNIILEAELAMLIPNMKRKTPLSTTYTSENFEEIFRVLILTYILMAMEKNL